LKDIKKYEYNFLKKVILRLKKTEWNNQDLRYIYTLFKQLVETLEVDETSLLRFGEVLLGQYCNIDYSNISDVRQKIQDILDTDELTTTVSVVIIAAMVLLSLSTQDESLKIKSIEKGEN
jgi:hypothetical protein